jgi:hypothetical protein
MVTPVVTGAWNAQMYANEALRYLSNRRNFLLTVNTSYDRERQSYDRGNTITIKKRQRPTVKDETDLSFEAMNPGTSQLTVDKYRHTSLDVLDWDRAFAGPDFLETHVFPCVDEIGDAVATICMQLAYQGVGPYHIVGGTPAVSDITATQKILLANKCPTTDEANMFFQISPTLNASLLNLSAFTQHQGAGERGVGDMVTGQLTRKFGFNFYPTQLLSTHSTTAVTGASPNVKGETAKGSTSIIVDDGTLTGSFKAGDAFTIAGDTTVYAITADATASGNEVTLSIAPELQVTAADEALVTFVQTTLNGQIMNLAYHREAFAFAAVPLPRAAEQMAAANVGVATDPQSGLSLRVCMGWDMATRKNRLVVDTLFGFKVLNPMLACRAAE